MEDKLVLKNRLKEARVAAGLSQGQLAEMGSQAGHPVWRYGKGLSAGLDI